MYVSLIMMHTFLLIATLLLADQPATSPPVETAAADQDAQTLRDEQAIAAHMLEGEGLNEASLPRYLWPALVEREAELRRLRLRLADLEVRLADIDAALAEMQDFVLDHDRYGDDFSQYRLVRRQAEQEARRQAALEHRARRQLKDQQRAAAQAAKQDEAKVVAKGRNMQETLRKMNFGLIGEDVWSGRSAYAYARVDKPTETVRYDPTPYGGTRVVTQTRTELDWSKMTISGSVLNAAKGTRNIGIAFAFFDEFGNQIGAETVVVNNARPGVPYPFTQKLDMAGTKPFASSTSWVLFSDPITPPAAAPQQAGAATP